MSLFFPGTLINRHGKMLVSNQSLWKDLMEFYNNFNSQY